VIEVLADVSSGWSSSSFWRPLRVGVPVYVRLGLREIFRFRNYWPVTV